MAGNSITFYIPKDKEPIAKILNDIAAEGELSNFIIQCIEMNSKELIESKIKLLQTDIKFWKRILSNVDDMREKEKVRKEKELQDQVVVVEKYIDNMVYQNDNRIDYTPPYSTTANYIKQDCGLKLKSIQIEKFYKIRLTGEKINYLKELRA